MDESASINLVKMLENTYIPNECLELLSEAMLNVRIEAQKLEAQLEEQNKEEEKRKQYFPACDTVHGSIVDTLKSMGVDSTYSNIEKIAHRNGIDNYSRTSSQNIHLLSMLNDGKLMRP